MAILCLALLLAPVLAVIILWGLKANFPASKNSKRLMAIAFLSGLLLAIPVKYLQSKLYPEGILKLVSEPLKDQLIFSFLIIALIEESSKFLLLKYYLFKSSPLQTPVQFVTIALLMAMGFATLENSEIAFQNGLSSYSQLMLMSVLAHASFSIIMCYFLKAGNKKSSNFMSLFLPVILHGSFLFTLLLKADPEKSSLVNKGLFFGILFIIYIIGGLLFYLQKKKSSDPE